MTTCSQCSTTYGGTQTQHCMGPGCHQTFASAAAGDMHRVGKHDIWTGPERRRCLTSEEMTGKGMKLNRLGHWTTGKPVPDSLRVRRSSLSAR